MKLLNLKKINVLVFFKFILLIIIFHTILKNNTFAKIDNPTYPPPNACVDCQENRWYWDVVAFSYP